MKNKKNYALIGILILLVIIAYFLTADRGEKTTSYEIEKKFFEIDSANVDKLEIERNGKKIVIEKGGINWNVTSPYRYVANQSFISSILSDLKKYKLESLVSDNPDRKDFFGFNDTNVTRVSVYQSGNLAGSFLIGNSAQGPSQTYIKKIDSKEIYLADGLLRNYFVKDKIDEWRDKLIFSIPKGNINSIELISSKENYVITKDSTGQFYAGRDSCKGPVFDGLLNTLQNFNTQGFKDTILGSETKFDKTIKVDWVKLTQIDFLQTDTTPPGKYLMKVSDNDQIFDVDGNFLNGIFKTKKEITEQK